ncbi:zinc finger protein [Halopolyspora algeriensis]|uniref:Zinc finger protein n=1 Tax=Halopolyspora algeriensis TaxID=1500506 RepID=A0A368VM64_9ACTN|nr:zinc finger protein [Halopolyspora algeriensis]RCW42801.1 zinc finger protein [Halopolyspora algeriensis]TQM56729.1 zinc finger protein [Halopolyspora algeriensis]
MRSDGTRVGLWQPVSSGRHAFEVRARRAEPGETVEAMCGVEVSTDELQRVAEDIDWIMKQTCMDCWRLLKEQQQRSSSS